MAGQIPRHDLNPARDLLRLLGVAVIENFGYLQLYLLVRIVGTFDYLVLRRKDVGASERYGGYQVAAEPTKRLGADG